MTISELLSQGGARLDAEVLLAYVLQESREYLVAHSDERVEPALCELFLRYSARVAEGEPVAYITGVKEFFGAPFYVDSRVLVPRPETEYLVESTLAYAARAPRPLRVLDVGTGSGNIAVSLARSAVEMERDLIEYIDAIDIDADALAVAQHNVEQYGVEAYVHLFQSDLLSSLENGAEYEVILANLPYIGEEHHRYVSAATEKYEPSVALFGGIDGLQLYKKMFQQIIEKDIRFSLMIGEFGFAQEDDLTLILNTFFEQQWRIEKDLSGTPRYFIVER